MRSVCTNFLLVFVTQCLATELASNQIDDMQELAVNHISVYNLLARLLERSSIHPASREKGTDPADLENTAEAKQASPISPTPRGLKHFALPEKVPQARKRVRNLQLSTQNLPVKGTTGPLTGQTISNGKYFICDNPQKFKTQKSQTMVYDAYRTTGNGIPSGAKLVIKISSDCEALSRESKNYDRVTSGLFLGQFVKKLEFLGEINAQPSSSLNNLKQCALVIEAGQRDLQGILAKRDGRGLEGRALRDAAAAAAQCIQAMHTSGIVWTDLKAGNFVAMRDEIGDSGGLPSLKGTNLERCMPSESKLAAYSSPETCPPEFARAFTSGVAEDFVLEYSYDIFSYGLLLYEVATGRSYFQGVKNPNQIINQLAADDFVADVSDVEDSKLRNLIEQCLRTNPKKRPSITQILVHPYFITTGIGPFGFN